MQSTERISSLYELQNFIDRFSKSYPSALSFCVLDLILHQDNQRETDKFFNKLSEVEAMNVKGSPAVKEFRLAIYSITDFNSVVQKLKGTGVTSLNLSWSEIRLMAQ